MKTFIKIIAILLILFGAFYFGANFLLKKIAAKSVEYLEPRLNEKGIVIERFDYHKVRLSSFNQCDVSDIVLDFRLNREMFGRESFRSTFTAQKLKVRFANLKRPTLYLDLNNFSVFIQPDDQEAHKPFGKMDNASISGTLPIYLKNPIESAKDVLADVKQLFRESKSSIDIQLATTAYLGLDDRELKVRMFTDRINDTTYLRFVPEDILAAAKAVDLEMVMGEAEVIARHPAKSLKMLKITRDAKRLSKLELERDASFPEDAYKHVYWSYHLTREFGPELAKEITDLHETKPGNTRQERLMDFHNNEVARKMAATYLSDDELKKLVLTSPEIIRDPLDIP